MDDTLLDPLFMRFWDFEGFSGFERSNMHGGHSKFSPEVSDLSFFKYILNYT